MKVETSPRKPKVILKFANQIGPKEFWNKFFIYWLRSFKTKLSSYTTDWVAPVSCLRNSKLVKNPEKKGMQPLINPIYEARERLLEDMLDVAEALNSFNNLQRQYSEVDQFTVLYQILAFEESDSCLISGLMTYGDMRKLFGTQKEMTLLYKATRDGFSAAAFHSKYDNKGATLTIFRTTTGRIAGGYTPTSWNSSSQTYVRVPQDQAYTFSANGRKISKYNNLDNNAKSAEYSMYCNQTYGPTFGNGHCLHKLDNSNSNTNS